MLKIRMTLLETIILGAVQGITEFLPISSTGHLVLARSFFDMVGNNALAFDAVLHLATVAAVLVYFRQDIINLFNATLRVLGRLPVNERDITLVKALVVATIPAVLLGLLLESYMETLFRNPLLVATVLVLGSLLFMYAEWRYINSVQNNEMNIKKGLLIGLFQTLALIPGMSRSGSCIAGGMILGLTREEATRFSFLLALPVLGGAGSKKLLELLVSSEPIAWPLVGVGALTAFIVGLVAIHFMITFLRKHTLWPFIWYRVVLAGLVLFVFGSL